MGDHLHLGLKEGTNLEEMCSILGTTSRKASRWTRFVCLEIIQKKASERGRSCHC